MTSSETPAYQSNQYDTFITDGPETIEDGVLFDAIFDDTMSEQPTKDGDQDIIEFSVSSPETAKDGILVDALLDNIQSYPKPDDITKIRKLLRHVGKRLKAEQGK